LHIEDLLSASDVVVDFAARDKADLLRAPAARAARVLKLSSDAVADTIQRRAMSWLNGHWKRCVDPACATARI
jgi:hypothetical protein